MEEDLAIEATAMEADTDQIAAAPKASAPNQTAAPIPHSAQPKILIMRHSTRLDYKVWRNSVYPALKSYNRS